MNTTSNDIPLHRSYYGKLKPYYFKKMCRDHLLLTNKITWNDWMENCFNKVVQKENANPDEIRIINEPFYPLTNKYEQFRIEYKDTIIENLNHLDNLYSNYNPTINKMTRREKYPIRVVRNYTSLLKALENGYRYNKKLLDGLIPLPDLQFNEKGTLSNKEDIIEMLNEYLN